MINIQWVSHAYQVNQSIFDPLDATIFKGDYVSLMGPSGSGKSTLFHLIAGILPVQTGELIVNNQSLRNCNDADRAHFRAQNIWFIFQAFHLFSHLNVEENILFPLQAFSLHQRFDLQALTKLLGIEQLLGRSISQLSWGEQQRVAIARAFIWQTPVILADEPTGNLDYQTTHRVMDILEELHQETQTTIFLITHDAEVAARAGRKWKFDQGTLLVDYGT